MTNILRIAAMTTTVFSQLSLAVTQALTGQKSEKNNTEKQPFGDPWAEQNSLGMALLEVWGRNDTHTHRRSAHVI